MYGQRVGQRKDYQDRVEQFNLDEEDLKDLLDELGVEYGYPTSTHYLIYCPIHGNTHTPSATLARHNLFFYCFSAECEVKMDFLEFVRTVGGLGLFPALRLIKKYESERDVAGSIKEIFAKPEDLPPFDPDLLKKYQEDFWETPRAKKYIQSRGISRLSAETFGLGYDQSADMVVTPMFDTNGVCIGVVKRSIDGKEFKNSFGLPKGKSLFGIHIAKKRPTEKVVICESNFDAIRAHQSGYAAVATLGAGFNEFHCTQLARSFTKVIIGVDVDEGGEKLAPRIANTCKQRGLAVYRIRYSEAELLPHGAKDFGDCTDDEIAQSIRLARPFVGS